MTTTVAFDKRSGRILSVYHGMENEAAQKDARRCSEIDAEHIELITIDHYNLDEKKRYKVDLARKLLIPAEPDESGIWFSFNDIGGTSSLASKG